MTRVLKGKRILNDFRAGGTASVPSGPAGPKRKWFCPGGQVLHITMIVLAVTVRIAD